MDHNEDVQEVKTFKYYQDYQTAAQRCSWCICKLGELLSEREFLTLVEGQLNTYNQALLIDWTINDPRQLEPVINTKEVSTIRTMYT